MILAIEEIGCRLSSLKDEEIAGGNAAVEDDEGRNSQTTGVTRVADRCLKSEALCANLTPTGPA